MGPRWTQSLVLLPEVLLTTDTGAPGWQTQWEGEGGPVRGLQQWGHLSRGVAPSGKPAGGPTVACSGAP